MRVSTVFCITVRIIILCHRFMFSGQSVRGDWPRGLTGDILAKGSSAWVSCGYPHFCIIFCVIVCVIVLRTIVGFQILSHAKIRFLARSKQLTRLPSRWLKRSSIQYGSIRLYETNSFNSFQLYDRGWSGFKCSVSITSGDIRLDKSLFYYYSKGTRLLEGHLRTWPDILQSTASVLIRCWSHIKQIGSYHYPSDNLVL